MQLPKEVASMLKKVNLSSSAAKLTLELLLSPSSTVKSAWQKSTGCSSKFMKEFYSQQHLRLIPRFVYAIWPNNH